MFGPFGSGAGRFTPKPQHIAFGCPCRKWHPIIVASPNFGPLAFVISGNAQSVILDGGNAVAVGTIIYDGSNAANTPAQSVILDGGNAGGLITRQHRRLP